MVVESADSTLLWIHKQTSRIQIPEEVCDGMALAGAKGTQATQAVIIRLRAGPETGVMTLLMRLMFIMELF